MRPVAFAIAAHPDDIEFMMAGTLLLLAQAGYSLHYLNIANGCCGSMSMDAAAIAAVRAAEARAAAKQLGACFHPSLVNDLEIFYDKSTLARVGALIRQVNPSIVLVPSPQDYMEDHSNAARLAVTATFCKGMPNWATEPLQPAAAGPCAIYHALPYGLHDGLRQRIWPDFYVDISTVLTAKRELLACHRSQQQWLDTTQGINAYLENMTAISAEVGRMSGSFAYAEGWRRHNHLGLAEADFDPLCQALARQMLCEPNPAATKGV